MAKVFLDANIFIDLIESRKEIDIKSLSNNSLFISPLSIHIASYLYKYKIPEKKIKKLDIFTLVSLNAFITKDSLLGPTGDFEDNVQLNSAATADCDIFLTFDKKLLKMKFFGKMEIKNKT